MNSNFNRLIATVLMPFLLISCESEPFKIGNQESYLFHVKNGDYLIPVLVRGNTAGKKIILYVQGGPGYNSLDYAAADYPGFKNSLETEYAVAYYDQRGTGNAQGNFTQGASVIATWVEDLHQVAAFLQKAYDAEVIMLGHSFGGALMYRYMIAKGKLGIPSKYISTNSPVTTDSDLDTLRWKFRREFLLNSAEIKIARGVDTEKWKEVLDWLDRTPAIVKTPGPNPYGLMNQWNRYVESLIEPGNPVKEVKMRTYLNVIFNSSYNVFPAFFNNKYKDGLISTILKEEEAYAMINRLGEITDQEILIMTGRFDDICPPEELEFIHNQIASSRKHMVVIENAGHEPFTNQPSEFFLRIKSFIQ